MPSLIFLFAFNLTFTSFNFILNKEYRMEKESPDTWQHIMILTISTPLHYVLDRYKHNKASEDPEA